MINTPAGALSGFPPITSGDLNKPGPFNGPNGVNHALQVHFHLDHGDSAGLTPARYIQRTGTTSSGTDKKPADVQLGAVKVPGGFGGSLIGADGPGAHEIKRPSRDKIVVADAPGAAPLVPGDFPVTYKAHFVVAVAAAGHDIARVGYNVIIDKRTPTEVPNTKNESTVTGKEDLVRNKAL